MIINDGSTSNGQVRPHQDPHLRRVLKDALSHSQGPHHFMAVAGDLMAEVYASTCPKRDSSDQAGVMSAASQEREKQRPPHIASPQDLGGASNRRDAEKVVEGALAVRMEPVMRLLIRADWTEHQAV